MRTNWWNLAEHAAQQVRAKWQATATLPLDVRGLAKDMGVPVVPRALVSAGRLETRAGRHRIAVRANLWEARTRFTIAHELGHLWLSTHGSAQHVPPHIEERFCNAFAGALLLPRFWIRRQGEAQTPTLEALAQVSTAAQVSLSTALIRLGVVPEWRRHSLLRWQWRDGSWRLTSVIATPADLRLAIGTTDRAERAFHLLARHKVEDTVPVHLWLNIAGSEQQVAGELRIRGMTSVAFLNLTDRLGI